MKTYETMFLVSLLTFLCNLPLQENVKNTKHLTIILILGTYINTTGFKRRKRQTSGLKKLRIFVILNALQLYLKRRRINRKRERITCSSSDRIQKISRDRTTLKEHPN